MSTNHNRNESDKDKEMEQMGHMQKQYRHFLPIPMN